MSSYLLCLPKSTLCDIKDVPLLLSVEGRKSRSYGNLARLPNVSRFGSALARRPPLLHLQVGALLCTPNCIRSSRESRQRSLWKARGYVQRPFLYWGYYEIQSIIEWWTAREVFCESLLIINRQMEILSTLISMQ